MAPMRKRRIKFALELKNGEQVRCLEELQEHFDLEKIIGYYQDGKLLTWLEDRSYYDEADEIKKLSGDESDLGRKLCRIFQIEQSAIQDECVDPETIAWRNDRLERLKQFTADNAILQCVDLVAFDQDDLEGIIHKEDTNTVYLCQNTFIFPLGILRKKNMKYIGIGKNVEVTVKHNGDISLPEQNISFDNVTVNEIKTGTSKNQDKDTGKVNSTDNKINVSKIKEWWKETDFLSELIYRVYSEQKPSKCLTSQQKPIFLYDGTLENANEYQNFNPDMYLSNDETMICVIPTPKPSDYGSSNKEVYVVFSDYAVYTLRPENSYLLSANYSDIEDVENGGVIKIHNRRNGDSYSMRFPCAEWYFNAMRRFLLVAADKRSILFENNTNLYDMKFSSLGGKTIGQMLVQC